MTKKNAIIVGAGDAGRELLDLFKKQPSLGNFRVIGFIDDDPAKEGKRIKDVRVIGGINNLEEIVEQNLVETVFIAIPSAEGSTIQRIIEHCKRAGVSFRIVPRILEIVQGKVSLEAIRPVAVEDVLGRAIVKSDQKGLEREFKNKRILITGAAGSIGSELVKQLSQFSPKLLILLDWWENGLFELDQELSRYQPSERRKVVVGNIQDEKKIAWIFKTFKPDIVFHAAAFKHVPLMEEHPEEAVKDNILGTKVCAQAAVDHGVLKFIFISSDKAVNPSSVMGATKLFAELIVKYFNNRSSTKFISVRFGNVLGSHGSVLSIFQKQIREGGPVTVTHPEMTRYFMTIPEAVQLILQAAIMGVGGEIFILDMGEPVKIMDLAKTMIRLAGFEPEKEIPIEITGTRPGEKLFEELSTREEKLAKTTNQRIFVTKNVIKINDRDLLKSLDRLARLAEEQDKKSIVRELSRTISTYQARQS
ncbi:MAG: nucleoside-diphosphate sugar epimerase/dehydratase [bacterium]|nr:nucleoside-diphosphate sugar epimerase/dehydratase [bacterium]